MTNMLVSLHLKRGYLIFLAPFLCCVWVKSLSTAISIENLRFVSDQTGVLMRAVQPSVSWLGGKVAGRRGGGFSPPWVSWRGNRSWIWAWELCRVSTGCTCGVISICCNGMDTWILLRICLASAQFIWGVMYCWQRGSDLSCAGGCCACQCNPGGGS